MLWIEKHHIELQLDMKLTWFLALILTSAVISRPWDRKRFIQKIQKFKR